MRKMVPLWIPLLFFTETLNTASHVCFTSGQQGAVQASAQVAV